MNVNDEADTSNLLDAFLSTEIVDKFDKDIRIAAKSLSKQELQYLTYEYYTRQEDRIRQVNQHRTVYPDLEPGTKPTSVINFFANANAKLETRVKQLMTIYAEESNVGEWLLSIAGIGPVFACASLSYFDITKAPSAGHFWSYAGQLPDQRRKKGVKINYNPHLKKICWLMGNSFVKVQASKSDTYGAIYAARKVYENNLNETGAYAEQAKTILATMNFGDDTKAKTFYLAGKLPPGHIHARCMKYAVKIFLSHLHAVMYYEHYGVLAPKPFMIAIMNHTHEVPLPHWKLVENIVKRKFGR